MNLAQLHEALRVEILRRIEDKSLSGKSLAMRTGMKQPHISNFLNRRRMLSIKAIDLILRTLNLRVDDLVPGGIANRSSHPESSLVFETVPLVSQDTAMNSPNIAGKGLMGALPLLRGTLERLPTLAPPERKDWDRFVAIRITSSQAREMQPILRPHAYLLIDRHYISLKRRKGELPSLYAVSTPKGLAVRYVTLRSNRLILRCFSHTDPVALLEPSPGQSANELIVGRVCLVLSHV